MPDVRRDLIGAQRPQLTAHRDPARKADMFTLAQDGREAVVANEENAEDAVPVKGSVRIRLEQALDSREELRTQVLGLVDHQQHTFCPRAGAREEARELLDELLRRRLLRRQAKCFGYDRVEVQELEAGIRHLAQPDALPGKAFPKRVAENALAGADVTQEKEQDPSSAERRSLTSTRSPVLSRIPWPLAAPSWGSPHLTTRAWRDVTLRCKFMGGGVRAIRGSVGLSMSV